jgi:hypothetical protein
MDKQQPKGSRRCIFCGSAEMSNAHVFRLAWIEQLFPQPEGSPYRHQRQGHSPGDEGLQEWFNRAADFKVKDVCVSCNSGWMNELDHAAEDVFTTRAAMGLDVKLVATAEKTTVARWCSLIAVLFDRLANPVRLGSASHDALYAGGIPDGTMVWLGAALLEPGYGQLAFGWPGQLMLIGDVLAPGQSERDRGSAYFVTFGVGHLVVQVLIPTPDTRDGAKVERRFDPKVLRQFWPDLLLPFGWPPPFPIAAANLRDFAREFHRDRIVVSSQYSL